MRPPLISQDSFENRAKNGVHANLRIEMIDEEADSVLGDATDFRVDLRHHVPGDRNGHAKAALFLICLSTQLNMHLPHRTLRIFIEEAVLRKGLPGYEEYAHRIRYRLIPGVW